MTATPDALITDPNAIAAYLAGVLALIFWLSGVPRLKKFFDVTPPVIYAYFLPTLSTAFGVTPPVSVAYDWIIRYLLPTALFLLMISVDVRSILRLGPLALFMMVSGTLGILIGGPIALLLFGPMLPPEAWKGFAALSGSWIGGTLNMVAIAESVGTPDGLLGPIIVVDTVVGYGWMAILLFLSAWQQRFDRRMRARTEVVAEANRRLAELESRRHPLDLRYAGVIIGAGFAAAGIAVAVGNWLPELGDPKIISATTWGVLLVVTAGLALSFTPVSSMEEWGASRIGYVALYLLIAAIGAKADLRAVLQAPAFLAAGVVWIAVHAAILLVAARIVRAPLFFFATGSMANIGGPASAPVVAGVYHPAMAPVGLLMAVAGYILGIYAGLVAAFVLGRIGG
ncbi:MAG: DUF819 family protein [Gemmatimonadota bacterium]|nr:DUF819 family protein [Gemmatimonadota bacterium]